MSSGPVALSIPHIDCGQALGSAGSLIALKRPRAFGNCYLENAWRTFVRAGNVEEAPEWWKKVGDEPAEDGS